MKKYFVFDWYEDWDDPDYLGSFDTVEEAEEACDHWEADTDSECDCIIYTTATAKEELPKIYQLALRKEKLAESSQRARKREV